MERQGFQFPASRNQVVDGDVAARAGTALRVCLTHVFGRSDPGVEPLIQGEVNRTIPKNTLRYLKESGIELAGKTVLDLGAGLGGLSEELAIQTANVVAIEPGQHWGRLARDRLAPYPRAVLVHGVGETLPFRDNTFDVVISLQVLEHVQNPTDVLLETFRVCRPGGAFFLSCENYLSFREPHYLVFWLPLLPKSIGRIYLRLRGRSPEFLDTSVTYTTLPGVLRDLRKAGFLLQSETALTRKLEHPEHFVRAPVRLFARVVTRLLPRPLLVRAIFRLKTLLRLCTNVVYELCYKPTSAARFPATTLRSG
jgi:SAM-dependent methyltransferase